MTRLISIDHRSGENYKTAEQKIKTLFPNKNFEFDSMIESREVFKKFVKW